MKNIIRGAERRIINMGIIYDLNQGKLVQNSLVGKINREEEFAERAKRLDTG